MASEHQNQSRILANSVLMVLYSEEAPRPASDRMARSLHGRVLGRAAELIADAADCLDEIFAGVEFLAQVADVHIDRAVERRGFAVIEVFHEGIAREHAPGGPHEQLEDI